MKSSVTPMLLEGARGRVFALHFCESDAPRAHILFLPAFGEEMNRCRHIVAQQARRFAANGYSCLVLDPYGTGDSEGELADASWDTWCKDVMAALGWCIERQALPVMLWGMRLGALLALDLAGRYPGEFERLLLWQPVTTGKTFLTQVLRQRIAYLAANEMPPETTQEMRDRLREGGTVEVAGYLLGGELAADIDSKKLADFAGLEGLMIHWLQQSSREDDVMPAAVQKAVDQLMSLGGEVDVVTFVAPQIWQLSERADSQDLVDKTSALSLL